MRNVQKDHNFFKFFIPLIISLYTTINIYAFFLQPSVFYLTSSLLPLVWFSTFFFYFSDRILGATSKKEIKQRIVFYSIFITFLLIYFNLLPYFSQIVLAITGPGDWSCSCSLCGFYSSSNCGNSCNEFQYCSRVTCSLSGCDANPYCYKCEWKPCDQIRPKVYVLTPVVGSGGEMKVSVVFECRQWTNKAKNLTLSLKINNLDWNECFLNNKGLMTDFGWNETCDSKKSGNCGRHNKWSCDSHSICKHSDYNLWVKSNFSRYYVNITFVCNLPQLSSGTHTLSVVAKIYESEIVSRPSRISFYVISGNEGKIIEILLLPIKILKRILLL